MYENSGLMMKVKMKVMTKVMMKVMMVMMMMMMMIMMMMMMMMIILSFITIEPKNHTSERTIVPWTVIFLFAEVLDSIPHHQREAAADWATQLDSPEIT